MTHAPVQGWHYWKRPRPHTLAPHYCGVCLRLTQQHAPAWRRAIRHLFRV